jgi:hypothetical protein
MRQAKDADGGSGTQAAGVVANSQFVGVGSTSLTFGYGRHACPGRFFAANEIKMIMAEILLRYEIVNPPGVEGRYKDMVNGASVSCAYMLIWWKIGVLTDDSTRRIRPSIS